MNPLKLTRRLESFAAGRPLPRGETIHVPLAAGEDALLVAFVRMGGESAPWGVALKRLSDDEPRCFVVPDPRNLDARAQMMERVAPILLHHLDHPDFGGRPSDEESPPLSLRQVWLPNAAHLDMMHNLAFTYSGAKKGPEERTERLRALGRAAGWLFREANRPGQVRVMVASRALNEAFSFPAEDVRLEHLGYQLALLTTEGDLEARRAAASAAEDVPVSTSLSPDLERVRLGPLVAAFHKARADRNLPRMKKAARGIRQVLEPELRRRIELTERALGLLRLDPRPVNPGVEKLSALDRKEHHYFYLGMERRVASGQGHGASAETDRWAESAAARYHAYNLSAQVLAGALPHYDRELRLEAVLSGDALSGRIVEVRDEGTGRKRVPIWIIEDSGELPLGFREGSSVCVAGLPKRTGKVRAVELAGGRRRVEVEITGWKTVPRGAPASTLPAVSPEHQGERVVLLEHVEPRFAESKIIRIRQPAGPGLWLTHGLGRAESKA